MKPILLTFLVFTWGFTYGQTTWPPPFKIATDTVAEEVLDSSYWQVLPDASGKLTIEDVQKPGVAQKFHFPQRQQEEKTRVYWFRFRLKNNMLRAANISLTSFGQWTNFYVIHNNGQLSHFRSGWSRPWSEIDGIKAEYDVPVQLAPGEEVLVYYRLRSGFAGQPVSGSGKAFYIGIRSTQKLIDRLYLKNESGLMAANLWDYYFSGGFFLLAAIFNLFFFFSARERVYLYFGLTLLAISSQIFADVFAREHPLLSMYFRITTGLWLFFFLHFVRYFFETFRYKPRWDKLMIAISLLELAIMLAVVYISPYSPDARKLFFTIFVLLIVPPFVTLVMFSRKGAASARMFMVAMAPFLLQLMVLFVLRLMNLMPPEKLADIAWELTLGWAILYFTRVLFRRYERQQKQIQQQELEREKLAREKEMEKSRLIEEQKTELERQVTERTAELKHSLEQLQATQAQLIHSEKMASLGELTAGIAHEVQNPLNFINNFSEVNTELIDDMQQAIGDGDLQSLGQIATDIRENNVKIVQHGKRADSIVKGMLQHSRDRTGEKQLTNINALADEYLKLSYHGMRAKDKNFNATMQTNFDEGLRELNVVPQDIGRVLLNLFTNAFYAVMEKRKSAADGYDPKVSVTTHQGDGKVEIAVEDNGSGMEEKVRQKIFQPFFTTKPSGIGTGLGLSISYEIIRAHGGDVYVSSKRGEGTRFNIVLPAE